MGVRCELQGGIRRGTLESGLEMERQGILSAVGGRQYAVGSTQYAVRYWWYT